MRRVLINPLTEWLYFTALSLRYTLRNRSLSIGSMSSIKRCHFGINNTVGEKVKLRDVTLGDFSYISSGSSFHKTDIGKFCSIGHEVRCGLGKHPVHTFVSGHPSFYSSIPKAGHTFADQNYFQEFERVVIGNDVWIGARALIVDGVKIGHGAIVAAGALVSKDVPPYAIVGGVPAKVIKYKFREEQIDWLLKFNWWDRDIDWLERNFMSFHDIEHFLHVDSE